MATKEQKTNANLLLELLGQQKGPDFDWDFLSRAIELEEIGLNLLSRLGWHVETGLDRQPLFFKPVYKNQSNGYQGWQIGFLLEKGRGCVYALKPNIAYDFVFKQGTNIRNWEIVEEIYAKVAQKLKNLKRCQPFKDNLSNNKLRIFNLPAAKNKDSAIGMYIEIVPGITDLPGWEPIER